MYEPFEEQLLELLTALPRDEALAKYDRLFPRRSAENLPALFFPWTEEQLNSCSSDDEEQWMRMRQDLRAQDVVRARGLLRLYFSEKIQEIISYGDCEVSIRDSDHVPQRGYVEVSWPGGRSCYWDTP